MTLQILSPDDSGEIRTRSHPEIGAWRRDVGGETVNIPAFLIGPPRLRRPEAEPTGEVPTLTTIGIVEPLAPLDQAPPDHDTVTNLPRPALYARTRARPGGRHRAVVPSRWRRLIALLFGGAR